MNTFLKHNWPSILWAAFILALCLMPGKDLPSVSIWQADKAGHFFVYVIFAVLTYWGWTKQTLFWRLHKNTALKILLVTFVYGFAVEMLQEILTTDRHFDMYDALANVAGGVGGVAMYKTLFKRS